MKTTLAVLLSVFSIALLAQKAPIKWGKVPAEALSLTFYPADTAAAALVLCDFGDVEITAGNEGMIYRFDRHRRLKLFKRSAFDEYGDVTIYYPTNSRDDRLTNVKAQVFAPDGTSVELKGKEIFDEKVAEGLSAKKISFPNLQEGSVIEFAYTLESGSYFELPEWYFQEGIPVRWSEYQMHIPLWYNYVFINQGRECDIRETTNSSTTLMIPYTGSSSTGASVTRRAPEQVDIKHYRLVQKDIPALTEEAYMTTLKDYRARIRAQLSTVAFPSQPIQPVLSTWEKLAKELVDHERFGNQYLKKRFTKQLMEDLQPILAKASNNTEKAFAVYQYLARTMEWNEDYGFIASENLNTVYERKKGHSGELNMLLLAALQELEITSYPMLISTRNHGKMFELYPILDQFNHLLVYAEVEGKPLIMDIGSPHRPMGLPRASALNYFGWVVVPERPQWLELPAPLFRSDVHHLEASVSLDGALTGSFTNRCEGYNAMAERERLSADASGAHLRKAFQEDLPDIKMDSLQFENVKDPSQSLVERFKFELPGAAQVNDDLIYLSTGVYKFLEENPFKKEVRTFAVDIPYPIREQYLFNLMLPEGYEVDALPEAITLNLPEKGGRFQVAVSQSERNGMRYAHVNYKLQIDQLHFEPEEYAGLRNFFSLILEKQEEQIVLRKKLQ